jgi:indolepyruvate ferredoxin oxidoreductase
MVTDVRSAVPDAQGLVQRVQRATRGHEAVALNADEISERLFGDHMPANMLLIGAAYQHGCLPLSSQAIERAIELNGAAVDINTAAFRWGRAAVADPAATEAALAAVAPRACAPAPSAEAEAILEDVNVEATLQAELAVFVPELVDYQDATYARRYAGEVERVAAIERDRAVDPNAPVAVAFARGLFKLMAYKDEYEVARLHLDAVERARLVHEFGAGAKVTVLLHPPLLRSLGLKRKLRIGRGARPLFKVLYRGRCLRGTRLDPFGYASVRRVERELIGEYRAVVARGLERLEPGTAALVAELAASPERLSGYEHIKLANVERMRTRISELLARLEQGEANPATELAIVASA